MTQPTEYESLFLAHLPFIDKALTGAARVLGLRGEDAEEFASWARERLWENDYAVLRKWRGQSKITTYLGTVIVNLGREFRVRHWGRWRHSAAAERLGPLALRLERLVYRDGWTLVEAAELLRSRQETELSNRELAAIMAKIPRRDPPRRLTSAETEVETIPDVVETGAALIQSENDTERQAIRVQLADALSSLKPTAEVVVRMHFLHGRSLADVGRGLATPQKPLYRIKDDALRTLRRRLEISGVTWDRLRDLFGGAFEELQGEKETDIRVEEAREIAIDGDNPKSRLSNESYDSSPIGEIRLSPDPNRTETETT